MKKIKRNDLRLEKEVISRLSQDDLTGVKGGVYTDVESKDAPCEFPKSYKQADCPTLFNATCNVSECRACETQVFTCPVQPVKTFYGCNYPDPDWSKGCNTVTEV